MAHLHHLQRRLECRVELKMLEELVEILSERLVFHAPAFSQDIYFFISELQYLLDFS